MTHVANQRMHEDHRRWQAENDLWRDEIALWQAEIAGMHRDLQRVQAALSAHESGISVHAGAIRSYQQDFGAHEHTLACGERAAAQPGTDQACSENASPVMPVSHEEEHAAQDRLREAHDYLKHRHHHLLAQWSHLLEALPVTSLKAEAKGCCGNCKTPQS
jgi:hypothetical protein